MKRLLAGLLACALSLSCLSPGAYASGTERASGGKANLDLSLRLAYPEEREALAKKKITVTLLDDQKNTITSKKLTADGLEEQFTLDGAACTVRVEARSREGTPVTTEAQVGSFRVAFTSLPNGRDYSVMLDGQGYKKFRSQPVALEDYSREMLVSTGDGTFTIGDVDQNESVDREDLDLVAAALGTSGSSSAADLNGDGAVDIVDVALVNHNIGASGAEALYTTTAVASAVARVEAPPEGVEVKGSLQDILNPESGPVTFGVTGETELAIPITFWEPQELSQVQIVSPDAAGAVREGTVTVVYDENGEDRNAVIPFSYGQPEGVHALTRTAGENTIVVDLGRRVAVKKITVIVTRAEGQDELKYAVVDEIKFIRDIVPDNPKSDSAVPQNVTAEAGDGKVTLTWKAIANVNGYRVRYGTAPGIYTMEANTGTDSAEIAGLKNLTPYYFAVCSTSGDWSSALSKEVTATPEPAQVPLPPDNVKLREMDRALMVSWGKTKNATSYSVYYKKTADQTYQQAASKLTAMSWGIGGLENGVEYSVYVTASNSMGESRPSLVSTAVPQKETLEPPKLPTMNRIPNSDITEVKLTRPSNVDMSQYPNGFDINNVKDGDFSTHWTARIWSESREVVFTFRDEKTMDYVIYVPRLDGAYRKSLDTYNIRVWDRDGKETVLASALPVQNNPAATGYAVLPFPKTEHIQKIGVQVNQWAGSPTNISLCEIAFYGYSDLAEQVQGLFANKSLTALRSGVTAEEIAGLEELAGNAEGYYVDREILLDELSVAKGLLNHDTSVLGRVLDGVESRNTSGDIRTVNTFQPLGVVANAKDKVLIYADIPEGETVQVVPTQYYAEASSWAGNAVTLVQGRNVVTIPQLTSVGAEKGGALYLKYAGGSPGAIRLQIRGAATAIPMLELSNWNSMSDSKRKQIIAGYVEELESYCTGTLNGKMGGKEQTFIRNSTEISLPNVLLSLPAMPVYRTLQGKDTAARIDQLYNGVLAWQDLIQVLYTTHGIDDPSQEHSRQNIRYARMFADAFMYASGAHIGIGYGSAAALVQGRPVSVTGRGNKNGLFGWGIAHEIGHVMDTLGKAEITNNIYSLFAQTYDGGENALTSRLEGGTYDAVFQKTAVGAPGNANNVFVSLAMYWQLHLAYDEGPGDNFYNRVNKEYRNGVAGFSGDEKFAVAASRVAGRDLTDFFEHWGIRLSQSAKSAMTGPREERAIWYLSDACRRQGGSVTEPQVTASLSERTATVTIEGGGSVQGYEISRNGVPIAFTRDKVFTDSIGSGNNQEIVYSVKAVGYTGNVSESGKAEPLLLKADSVVDHSLWESAQQQDGTILVTFRDIAPDLAGIRIKEGWTAENTLTTEPPLASDDDSAQDGTGSLPEKEEEPKDGQPDDNESSSSEQEPPASSQTPEESETGESSSTRQEEPGGASEEETGGESSSEPEKQDAAPESAAESHEEAEVRMLAAVTDVTDTPSGETSTDDDAPSVGPSSGEPSSSETSSEDDSSSEPPSDSASSGETSSGGVPSEEPPADGSDREEVIPPEPAPMPETPASIADPKTLLVRVSEDGESYRTALEVQPDPGVERTYLFPREGTSDGIEQYSAKTAILELPAGMTMDSVEFLSYSGDAIAFLDGGIGRLAGSFDTGDGQIASGTIVVVGTFRGDPVYNTVHVNGRYLEGRDTDEEGLRTVERPINGDIYLLAEDPGENGMAEIDGGIWIFVPDVQREQALTTKGDANACYVSVLPGEIRAELYRTDDPDGSGGKRVVSNTLWISAPTEDTMPQIRLEGENR